VPGPGHPHAIPTIAALISRCDSAAIRPPPGTGAGPNSRTDEDSADTPKAAVNASAEIREGDTRTSHGARTFI
jgi:hypothetical protein